MTNAKWLLGAGAAALLAASGMALAGPGMGKGMDGKPMAMRMMDADGNGEVTRAEVQAGAEKMFARMDVNGDGKLDKADREAKMAEMFSKADANGDGELTREEMKAMHEARRAEMEARRAEWAKANPEKAAKWAEKRKAGAQSDEQRHAAHMEQMFGTMDTDGNGKLSKAEMAAAQAKMGEMRGMHRSPDAAGKTGGGHGKMGGHRGHGGAMMMADTDKDGAISAAEFQAAAMARFARIDADGNGVATAAEIEAARMQMRGGHKSAPAK